MIVTAGPGPHRVATAVSPAHSNISRSCSSVSSIPEDAGAHLPRDMSPEKVRKQVLVIGDSMVRCLPASDAIFKMVVRDDYQFSTIAQDIVAGVIDIQYKFIIVWAGAHAIHRIDLTDVPAQLKSLVNIIRNRNPTVRIFISALLPKPREYHITETMMIAFNRGIKAAINYIRQQGFDIQYLQSHLLFLDSNRTILRPIIDAFDDGFHLNVHGAHRLRKFWLQQLGLAK